MNGSETGVEAGRETGSEPEGEDETTKQSDTILRTEDLTKRFGQLVAVDDVNLNIGRGEFRSIIGPNGAGKTTLFNLITGALSPSEGVIEFNGEDIAGLLPHERVKRGIGRSFQITTIFGGLTVRENIRLASQSKFYNTISPPRSLFTDKNSFEDINRYTENILERVELADHADESANTLAYGDKRTLEIGLVLATDPELVLLDEPTAGMSGDETRDTINLIEEVLADKTLILVEHDIDLVMSLSDYITVLHRGSVLAEGTPEEISENQEVQDAYLGGVDE